MIKTMDPDVYTKAKLIRTNIYIFPNARFTVLTERMIRFETDRQGIFDNKRSQIIWFRNQPTPPMSVIH